MQHNPIIADGIEGFKAFLCFLEEKFPGDFVILHTNGVRAPGSAARRSSTSSGLKTDVIQPIPENAVNQNGMF